MSNLSLTELELIAKSRGIKGYKSVSEDKLLNALNASELVKESKTMLDPSNINKTIREIRKENRDEDKVLRDFKFLFDPEKNNDEPKKNY